MNNVYEEIILSNYHNMYFSLMTQNIYAEYSK
jgi:hypothetical protein